jgi:hypothetical protein
MKTPVKKKKGELKLSVDEIEAAIASCEQVHCPVRHIFTPGLYTREITMAAGLTLTSKIHKTEHPFVVSKGIVKVWTEEEGTVLIEAPYTGITKPGTRRVLTTLTETIWTTFHVNPKNTQDLKKIEKKLIAPHVNELLTEKENERIKSFQSQPVISK